MRLLLRVVGVISIVAMTILSMAAPSLAEPRIPTDLRPLWSDQPAGEISKTSISRSLAWELPHLETLLNVSLASSMNVQLINLREGSYSLDICVTTSDRTTRRTVIVDSSAGSYRFDNWPRGHGIAILRSLDPHRHLFLSTRIDTSGQPNVTLRLDGQQTGTIAIRVLDSQNRPMDFGLIRLTHPANLIVNRRIGVLQWKIEDPFLASALVQQLSDGTFIVTGLGAGGYTAEFWRNGVWERAGGQLTPGGGAYLEIHQRTATNFAVVDPNERAADFRHRCEQLQSPFVPVRAWGIVRLGGHGADAVPLARQLVEALGDTSPVTTFVRNEHTLETTIGQLTRVALQNIGHGALPEIIQGLKHDSHRVRCSAADTLGDPRFRDESAVEPLLELFDDPDTAVRWIAARSLGFIGQPALNHLLEETRSGSIQHRRLAIFAISLHRHERTDDALIAALHDPAPAVRREAADRLCDYNQIRMAKRLIEELQTSDPTIRPLLIRSLQNMGSEIVDELFDAAESPENDLQIRRGALQVLANCTGFQTGNDRRALRFLPFMTDKDAEIRRWATVILPYSLTLIGPRDSHERITAALRDDDFNVRTNAAAACSKFADNWQSNSQLVLQLIAAMTDASLKWIDSPILFDDVITRSPEQQAKVHMITVAASTLGRLRDKRATAALIQVLERCSDPGLRLAAITALCAIADPDAAVALRAEMKPSNVAVVEALGVMRDRESLDDFTDLLDSTWLPMVCAAATALGRLDDERALDPLMDAFQRATVPMFRSHDDHLGAIAHALGRIGNAETAKRMLQTAHQVPPLSPNWHGIRHWPVSKPAETSLDELISWHPYPESLALIGPAAIPYLIEGLSSEHALTRAVCAAALANLQDDLRSSFPERPFWNLGPHSELFAADLQREIVPATTALLKAIGDDEPIVRLHAIRAVGRFRMTVAVPYLVVALNAPFQATKLPGGWQRVPSDNETQHKEVRATIARSLGEIGGADAEAALRTLINNSDPIVQVTAIRALESATTKESVSFLIKLLSHQDTNIAAVAIFSLANIRDRSAIQPLMACLAETRPERIRMEAIRALGLLDADEARPVLRLILEQLNSLSPIQVNSVDPPDPRTEFQRTLMEQAAATLILLKDDAGESVFKRALASSTHAIRNDAVDYVSWHLRDRPVSTWSRKASILPALRKLAIGDSDFHVRCTAITALQQPTDEASRNTLVACLKDEVAQCRLAALLSLAAPQPTPISLLPTLLQMQNDPSPDVRITVIELLGPIQSPQADESLLKLFDDGDGIVSDAALKELLYRRSPDIQARLRRFEQSTHSPRRRAMIRGVLARPAA